MIDKVRLIKLTQKLIRINSENPPGDEEEIAWFVRDYLKQLGLKSRIYEFKKKRANILAVLKGRNKKYLLITPHLDTVPSGNSWTIPPFKGLIKNNKIYGLGATDCKVNLAVSLEVINSVIEDKKILHYNLIFAATADEECGSGLGLIPLLNKGILKPDEAVVLDADDFEIIITQKGLLYLKITIQGKKAHGAYPERGVFPFKKNRYLRHPTVNIGTIRGGDKVNIVADWCELELDFRFLPGSNAQSLLKVIKKIAVAHAKKFKVEVESSQAPYSISQDHPLVCHLKKAMQKFKIKPRIKGSEGATVITFFQHKNIPAIATGFGCGGCAHTADEYIKINDLYKGALVLEEFLTSYKFNQ
ncbi:MAG: M20/M25/M40 family metallo-hydrolase [Candidatus Omnitrophica bacterium]|nr:M20/M25/M40 family metallo-hydrolase [Candidatus Omnitrophota bacterium]